MSECVQFKVGDSFENMEKIQEEFDFLEIATENFLKLYYKRKDAEPYIPSEKFKEYASHMFDILGQYRRIDRWMTKAKDREYGCTVKLEMVCKNLEILEREISKSIPESAKWNGTYGDIVKRPVDTNAKMIAWMFDYAAYLHGMAYGFDLMEIYLPSLSMLKSDITELQEMEKRFSEKETLWGDILRMKVDVKKFEKESEDMRLANEKEEVDNFPSVVERLSLEKRH